jgi:SHS2 domain-containing protein
MDSENPNTIPFEVVEHPGDLKLQVRGDSLEELFANAATGMIHQLFDPAALEKEPEAIQSFELTARDLESLLVDWLSEVLYRVTSDYRAFVDICVSEVKETSLKATAGAIAAEAVDDIKAVTYHELSIKKRNSLWEATVVFDL